MLSGVVLVAIVYLLLTYGMHIHKAHHFALTYNSKSVYSIIWAQVDVHSDGTQLEP
jgi:hypothetical protein